MQPYEVNAVLEALPMADRNAWEQTRMLMYSDVAKWSKNELKPTDILRFAWEKTDEPETETEITNEDIERLEARAKELKMRNIQ